MKHYHCPVNGWDCPYYVDKDQDEHCLCTIADPINECDDFFWFWGECDPEDYTDDSEED